MGGESPLVGVIYDVASGQIRWLHVPDQAGDEATGVQLLPGEALAILPRADLVTLQAAIHTLTGS